MRRDPLASRSIAGLSSKTPSFMEPREEEYTQQLDHEEDLAKKAEILKLQEKLKSLEAAFQEKEEEVKKWVVPSLHLTTCL